MLWDEFLTIIQEELKSLEKDSLLGQVISKTVYPIHKSHWLKLCQRK